jgi:ABC-type multidrug transport system ATPase subunit
MEALPRVLEVKDVTKTFGSLSVLKRLSLSCGSGEVVLIVGANGAGKSTLLRAIAGLAHPDSGSVIRNTTRIGFLSHHLFLYGRLSVRENIKLFASVQGASEWSDVVSRLELSKVVDRPVSELSKGMQARVGIARAFLGSPELILLDEPTSNLDEKGTSLLLGEIARRRSETNARSTFLIATHDLHRMASIATRVVVLADGNVVADSGDGATPDTISRVLDRYREVNR